MFYIRSFNSLYSNRDILLNLLGNFFMCVPFSFFLPILFDNLKKTFKFSLTIIVIILSIEVLQLLTCSGSFDIDDIILNVSGVLIFYKILRIGAMWKLLENIFLKKSNKFSKDDIRKIVLILSIIILIFISIIGLKSRMYSKNMDDYYQTVAPKIDFVFDNNCSNNNLIYEDELNKYFLECYDNDKFYIILNDTDKFKVKDLINNEKYDFSINRVLRIFDYNHIKYTIEHKFVYYEFQLENANHNVITIDPLVEDDIVKLIIKESNKGNDIYDVTFIPKKCGNTKISFKILFFDNDGNVESREKVSFNAKVTDDYNVIYERL